MWSGRTTIATRLSVAAIRSYCSQSAIRRGVVALKMWRRARRSVSEVGVSGVDELGPALEHEEARPPVDVRDQHRAARIAQEVLELRARLRDGNAHTAVARVYGDDAELRHPVAPERGQYALRIVVQELLDLRWQRVLCRHGCGLLECGAHDRGDGASGPTARPAFYPHHRGRHLLDRCHQMSYPALSKGWVACP